ncbi:MAG: hypothetical protein ACI4RT_03135 [Candidatus Spyradenecus sp.]
MMNSALWCFAAAGLLAGVWVQPSSKESQKESHSYTRQRSYVWAMFNNLHHRFDQLERKRWGLVEACLLMGQEKIDDTGYPRRNRLALELFDDARFWEQMTALQEERTQLLKALEKNRAKQVVALYEHLLTHQWSEQSWHALYTEMESCKTYEERCAVFIRHLNQWKRSE